MALITTKDLEAYKSRAGKATRAPQIAKCPLCEGDNIFRHAEEGEGPGDYCIDCGHSFPHVPGSITADQHARRQPVAMMSRAGQVILLSASADDGGGHWVTLDGQHVYIGKGGVIEKGPAHLVGKKPGGGEHHHDFVEAHKPPTKEGLSQHETEGSRLEAGFAKLSDKKLKTALQDHMQWNGKSKDSSALQRTRILKEELTNRGIKVYAGE